MNNIQRIGTTQRFSDAVIHKGIVYLVEVPGNLDEGISAQTSNLLASVERLLSAAGSDKSRLLLVTIYLADMVDYDAMNAVWDDWLPAGTAPARACLQARLAKPQYRVEMVMTAAVQGA
jgi:enamine deaminase RidA (YjgF/YER057c/UK114 family)